MTRKLSVVSVGTAILFTALHMGKAMATEADGFTGVTLAKGQLGDFEVFNHVNPPDNSLWLSWQRAKGASDLYLQSNTWQAGGSTGWHTHPGHSLIIVTAGTVTTYEGNDPACKPTVYSAGMAFVDPGGDHVHMIRNETGAAASTIAVQVIPAGAVRRIDAPNPGNCPF